MVCCMFLAGVFALLSFPLRWIGFRSAPLAWRPYASAVEAKPTLTLAGRVRSVGYALEGVGTLIRSEYNAWVHLAAAALVVGMGFALHVSLADWRWLIVAIAIVLAAEAANSAIEELCDHLHPERHIAVKRVKDLAAASVLLCAIGAALIGALTLAPYLLIHLRMTAANAGWPLCAPLQSFERDPGNLAAISLSCYGSL